MKKYYLLFVLLAWGYLAKAQYAEPAVTGANFIPSTVSVGNEAVLKISFANSGSTAIPVNSIELTISTASVYYKTDGINQPTGTAASLFNWTYLGSDIWRGSNKVAVAAYGGGDIELKVKGILVSTAFETTNVNVQPTASFTAFTDAPSNNNLQPKLKVTAPVRAIYAFDDNVITNKGIAVSGNVLINDDKATGTAPLLVSTTPVMQPANGTLTLSANGNYSYTPNATYTGLDSFKYRVCDSGTPAVCDTATVSIFVRDPAATNNAPIALGDNAATKQDVPVSGNVLTNDKDLDAGQTLTASLVTDPTNGMLTLNPNGTFTYTPKAGFFGDDKFTYKACDNGMPQLCTNATVDLNIYKSDVANMPPVANADVFIRTPSGNAIGNVLTNDQDPENGTLTINTTPIVMPTNGNVVINLDGTVTYTPNAGYTGADQFVYEVCDNYNPKGCSQAVVFIIPNNSTGTADLKITKTVEGNRILALNETVTFKVVVKNLGPNPATNVVVKDSVGAGLQLLSGIATKGSFTSPLWTIPVLASGDSAVLTVSAKLLSEGISFNYAMIKSSEQTDPIKANNEAETCVSVPLKLCSLQSVEASVPSTYTNVVWFKNGQQVATGNSVLLSEMGIYTFTANNATCPANGCCPLIIEAGNNCCPVQLCIPVTVVKKKK